MRENEGEDKGNVYDVYDVYVNPSVMVAWERVGGWKFQGMA